MNQSVIINLKVNKVFRRELDSWNTIPPHNLPYRALIDYFVNLVIWQHTFLKEKL